jgi:hypothetical protein
LFQRWKFILKNVPDDLDVNSKILMRQYVSQSGDLFPLNGRMFQARRFGDHLDRFADYFQIADDSIDSLIVIFKSFSRAGVPARAARVGW